MATELATAMRGLVQVHKVHVDAVPRQRRVELGVCFRYYYSMRGCKTP